MTEVTTPNAVTPLTDKQEKFCREYVIDLNATRAAVRAGYSEKSARDIGSRLLKKAEVKQFLAGLQKEAIERAGYMASRVIQELSALSFARATDFVTVEEVEERHDDEVRTVKKFALKKITEVNADDLGAVSEIKQSATGFSLKMHNKISALKELNKHLALLTRVSSSVPDADEPYILLSNGVRIPI